MSSIDKRVLILYAVWAGAVVLVCFLRDGLSADNFTRALVLGFLAGNLGWYWLTRHRLTARTGTAFVLRCSLGALVVEFCYMFSRPVFPSLLVPRETAAPLLLLRSTLVDFAFTFPAYLVIFSLVWFLINRYRYRVSEYTLLFSLGQALGDGNAFFIANPAMLLLAPYVMLNYQACNVVPYLRVRQALPPEGREGALKYILPLTLIPAVYWCTGAAIILAGRAFGLAVP